MNFAHKVLLSLICPTLVGAVPGTAITQEDPSSVFAENPEREDPALELQRLRVEGVAQYEAGLSLDDAVDRFKSAFELSGAADDAFNVALVAFRQNNTEEMHRWLERVLEIDQQHPNANYLLGVAAKTDGDFEAARGYWLKTVDSYPQDAQLHYQIALVQRSLGDEEAFLQSLIHALGLDPDHPGALYQMSRAYRMDGNMDAAKATMERFTGVKQRERFSRRETAKEPSALTTPIKGFREAESTVFRDTALTFDLVSIETGCVGETAFPLPEPLPDADPASLRETALVICDDGTVLHVDGETRASEPIGTLPAGASDVTIGTPDAAGRRILFRQDGRLTVSSPIAAGELSFTDLGAAPAPMRPADIDSDGDLDLVFLDGTMPLTNSGDLTFIAEEQVYAESELLTGLAGALDARAVDVRRNGMTDFAVVDETSVRLVAGNVLGFDVAWSIDADYAASSRLTVADLDASGVLDLLVYGEHGLDVYWNASLNPPEVERQIDEPLAELFVADMNNDSLFDLISTSKDGDVAVRLNQLGGAFAAPQTVDALTGISLIADLNGDDRLDLAFADDGVLHLAANGSDLGAATRVLLEGIRSAPSGKMSQVEVRSGIYYAYTQSDGGVVHVGLGDDDYAEVIRLEWTNGFIENKLNVQAEDGPYLFVESERISGSCPSVFTWNGERFHYLSDAFISGPMGVPIDRGVYFPISDRETIVIDDGALMPRDGSLEIRFTEELLETVYLDRAELVAVDHPSGSVVTAHSRLAAPPVKGEDFYVAERTLPVVRAKTDDGFDVTAELSSRDGIYAEVAEMNRQNVGFANPHWIEFELPDGVRPDQVDALLARGWFYYFDSTSMIAQAQRDKGEIGFPMLEQYVDGHWQMVGPVGVPSGKDKVALMPLQGLLSSSRLRLSSAIAIYWDELAVSLGDVTAASDLSALPMAEANLRFRGLSKMTQRHPELFDYHAITYAGFWNPMVGAYSSYGSADEMVAKEDGIYAIFGTGDEIAFSFEPPAAPPAEDMERSYLLRLVGYVKDGDRYTSDGNKVDPVPFHGMMEYPAEAPANYVYPETQMRRVRQPFDYTLHIASKDQEP